MSIIQRNIESLADTLNALGVGNKHDIPWEELLEEEFALWLVDKFTAQAGYAELIERKHRQRASE